MMPCRSIERNEGKGTNDIAIFGVGWLAQTPLKYHNRLQPQQRSDSMLEL